VTDREPVDAILTRDAELPTGASNVNPKVCVPTTEITSISISPTIVLTIKPAALQRALVAEDQEAERQLCELIITDEVKS